jgi:hypothetical protein
MKYIVIQIPLSGVVRELPVLFPNLLVHSDVLEAMLSMPYLANGKGVAAGEFSSLDLDIQCAGTSVSTGLASRKTDGDLIAMMDYCHGVTEIGASDES